jgi:hypothetical protein
MPSWRPVSPPVPPARAQCQGAGAALRAPSVCLRLAAAACHLLLHSALSLATAAEMPSAARCTFKPSSDFCWRASPVCTELLNAKSRLYDLDVFREATCHVDVGERDEVCMHHHSPDVSADNAHVGSAGTSMLPWMGCRCFLGWSASSHELKNARLRRAWRGIRHHGGRPRCGRCGVVRSWRTSPQRPQRGREVMEDVPAAAAVGA